MWPPRLQNSPYFCVFKNARAVKQKFWNKAENREQDWGKTLNGRVRLARFAPCFTDFFTDFEKNRLFCSLVTTSNKTNNNYCERKHCSGKTWSQRYRLIFADYNLFLYSEAPLYTYSVCGSLLTLFYTPAYEVSALLYTSTKPEKQTPIKWDISQRPLQWVQWNSTLQPPCLCDQLFITTIFFQPKLKNHRVILLFWRPH